MRTKRSFEYIISQSPSGEVTLMATQNCAVDQPEKVAEVREVPKEQAETAAKEEES